MTTSQQRVELEEVRRRMADVRAIITDARQLYEQEKQSTKLWCPFVKKAGEALEQFESCLKKAPLRSRLGGDLDEDMNTPIRDGLKWCEGKADSKGRRPPRHPKDPNAGQRWELLADAVKEACDKLQDTTTAVDAAAERLLDAQTSSPVALTKLSHPYQERYEEAVDELGDPTDQNSSGLQSMPMVKEPNKALKRRKLTHDPIQNRRSPLAPLIKKLKPPS